MPGLSFMARYITGSGADGTGADCSPNGAYCGQVGNNEDEWERDLEVKYVVQTGAAKDLSIRVLQATSRASQGVSRDAYGTGNSHAVDEIRIVDEYPLDIL